MKTVKVKMKVATGYNGIAIKPGQKIDLAPIVAERWVAQGIAEEIKPSEKPKYTPAVRKTSRKDEPVKDEGLDEL